MEDQIFNFRFTSKYDYIKSLQEKFDLTDEECNTFLWILDMWDKKKEVPHPEDFKLISKQPPHEKVN
jgi:hypothetical protein